MSITTAIVVNVILWVSLVSLLIWLLAHPGIVKARGQELRLFRHHSLRRR